MSRFSDRYASMSDDELVRIAIRGELMPEALTSLNTELEKRGISNLEDISVQFEADRESVNALTDKRIENVKAVTSNDKRLFYMVSLVAVSIAGWKWFVIGDKHNAIGISVTIAVLIPCYLVFIKLRLAVITWLMRRQKM